MNKQNSQGIYTYVGTVNDQGAFNGQGTLTYPSGNKVIAKFDNNQLQIGEDLAQDHNKINTFIDCMRLTQDQFTKRL